MIKRLFAIMLAIVVFTGYAAGAETASKANLGKSKV